MEMDKIHNANVNMNNNGRSGSADSNSSLRDSGRLIVTPQKEKTIVSFMIDENGEENKEKEEKEDKTK